MKRVFDLVVAAAAVVLLAPLMRAQLQLTHDRLPLRAWLPGATCGYARSGQRADASSRDTGVPSPPPGHIGRWPEWW